MNATYKLVEIVKTQKGIESDYGIAMLLGVSKGMISHWKLGRSEANGVNLLRLIKEANLSIDDALKIMSDVESKNNEQLKQAGFGNVFLLSSLSLSGLGMMTLAKMSAVPYAFDAALLLSAGTVYYVKSDGKIFSAEIESKLPHLSRHNLMHLVAANDAQIDQVFTGRQY